MYFVLRGIYIYFLFRDIFTSCAIGILLIRQHAVL